MLNTANTATISEYDERKYELIDGVTYMMASPTYRHNMIGGNLHYIIRSYLNGKRCKVVYETKVYLDENNRFIPDLSVVCDRNKIKPNGIYGAPDLVIEILSPSTRKNDLSIKKDIYEKYGVKEYWLIDPAGETVDVYIWQDGKFILDNSYHNYTDEEWDNLDDKERANTKLSLKISLYDDLEINVKDIFAE